MSLPASGSQSPLPSASETAPPARQAKPLSPVAAVEVVLSSIAASSPPPHSVAGSEGKDPVSISLPSGSQLLPSASEIAPPARQAEPLSHVAAVEAVDTHDEKYWQEIVRLETLLAHYFPPPGKPKSRRRQRTKR